MVAPGQDPPGRHPNEALLLEALDEFDSVESTPLKLCKPSLQNNQGGICSAIGDGSRVDCDEKAISEASGVFKGVHFNGGLRTGSYQEGGGSVFPSGGENDNDLGVTRVAVDEAIHVLPTVEGREPSVMVS